MFSITSLWPTLSFWYFLHPCFLASISTSFIQSLDYSSVDHTVSEPLPLFYHPLLSGYLYLPPRSAPSSDMSFPPWTRHVEPALILYKACWQMARSSRVKTDVSVLYFPPHACPVWCSLINSRHLWDWKYRVASRLLILIKPQATFC